MMHDLGKGALDLVLGKFFYSNRTIEERRKARVKEVDHAMPPDKP
ncbi:MAG: hypothetical protein WED15_07490 [Akkermansiaceae bacterium]